MLSTPAILKVCKRFATSSPPNTWKINSIRTRFTCKKQQHNNINTHNVNRNVNNIMYDLVMASYWANCVKWTRRSTFSSSRSRRIRRSGARGSNSPVWSSRSKPYARFFVIKHLQNIFGFKCNGYLLANIVEHTESVGVAASLDERLVHGSLVHGAESERGSDPHLCSLLRQGLLKQSLHQVADGQVLRQP